MKKLLMWFCCAVLFLMAGCSLSGKKERSNERYQVINPLIIDTSYYKEYVADIHAIKNVEIRSRVHGEIEKIFIDEGQLVKKGQLLFTINDLAYKEELSRARSQLKNAIAEAKAAELDLLNTKLLVEKNVVSRTELERSESKLDALNAKIDEARSQEASAQLKLSYTRILAPFDGLIDRIPFKMGSVVDEGTLLTTISDNSEVFAYFNVSETEYLNFVIDTDGRSDVSLILANATLHPYAGKVETIEGEFNKSTGRISFRARFPNPKAILKHGSTGKVRLRTELKNTMIVPQKSTFEIQEYTYVFVVDQSNIVRMKSFVPKLRLPNLYVVESGLSVNDKILFEGVQLVKDGDKITPELISSKQVLAQLVK